MTGKWMPSQGTQDFQNVTGTTLKGTQFDGRPEPAVLDTADGPAAAKAAGLPWLPSGLFHDQERLDDPEREGAVLRRRLLPPAGRRPACAHRRRARRKARPMFSTSRSQPSATRASQRGRRVNVMDLLINLLGLLASSASPWLGIAGSGYLAARRMSTQ